MSVTLRVQLLTLTDRIIAILLATLLAGTTLAFGGAVWWARPAIAVLTTLLLLGWLAHVLLQGRWRLLRSPYALLGLLGLFLGLVHIVPLPDPLAGWISPRSRAMYVQGVFPGQAAAASVELPDLSGARSPVTVDRSASLRWIAGAAVGLVVFWVVGLFTDRLGRLYVVWGSVVAVFFVNTTFALVQLIGQSGGLFGFLEPGAGGPYVPSLDDLVTTPNTTVLRLVSVAGEVGAPSSWAVARPARPFQIGSLMGGPGAYLALGALGLPLALGLILHLLAPRGSREDVWSRLRNSGQTGIVVLLCSLLAASALLIGVMAGPFLSVPFVLGTLLVGLTCAWPTGLRWTAVGVTMAVLGVLVLGVLLGAIWVDDPGNGSPLAERVAWGSAGVVWTDAWHIVRDFPVFGSGVGSFASIHPYYKSLDQAHTTARSSLLQWSAEAGLAGILLLALGALWCARRLPRAVRKVGTADFALASSLMGVIVCFGLFAAVHWTVEIAAVALAASAVGGTLDRWLAGGTDLFVSAEC